MLELLLMLIELLCGGSFRAVGYDGLLGMGECGRCEHFNILERLDLLYKNALWGYFLLVSLRYCLHIAHLLLTLPLD